MPASARGPCSPAALWSLEPRRNGHGQSIGNSANNSSSLCVTRPDKRGGTKNATEILLSTPQHLSSVSSIRSCGRRRNLHRVSKLGDAAPVVRTWDVVSSHSQPYRRRSSSTQPCSWDGCRTLHIYLAFEWSMSFSGGKISTDIGEAARRRPYVP